MQELIEIEKQKEREKEIEEQKKTLKKLESMKIREKIEQLRIKFKNYSPNSTANCIELHIRLPTGKRISQIFEKFRTILFVKHFILQLEGNGIEEEVDEEDDDDDLYGIDVLSGFPPKVLQEELTLLQCFGDSSGESLTVKLTY